MARPIYDETVANITGNLLMLFRSLQPISVCNRFAGLTASVQKLFMIHGNSWIEEREPQKNAVIYNSFMDK